MKNNRVITEGLPMGENTRQDIRGLLKRFGIKADEHITAYLGESGEGAALELRLTLEDVSGAMSPLTLDGTVRR